MIVITYLGFNNVRRIVMKWQDIRQNDVISEVWNKLVVESFIAKVTVNFLFKSNVANFKLLIIFLSVLKCQYIPWRF